MPDPRLISTTSVPIDTLYSVLDSVWAPPRRRHADLAMWEHEDHVAVSVYRRTGDIVQWLTRYVPRAPGAFEMCEAMDNAIAEMLPELRPLSVSDALVAGETRKLRRRGW